MSERVRFVVCCVESNAFSTPADEMRSRVSFALNFWVSRSHTRKKSAPVLLMLIFGTNKYATHKSDFGIPFSESGLKN